MFMKCRIGDDTNPITEHSEKLHSSTPLRRLQPLSSHRAVTSENGLCKRAKDVQELHQLMHQVFFLKKNIFYVST